MIDPSASVAVSLVCDLIYLQLCITSASRDVDMVILGQTAPTMERWATWAALQS